MQKKLHALDCTFRDGGYYNQWSFSPKLVQEYLSSISKSGIQKVELGFRFLPRNRFFGPFAYTTDSFLDQLETPDNLQIGVMVDAKEYADTSRTTLEKIFRPSAESKVQFVRVAVNIRQFETARPIIDFLKEKGYETTLNLMQIGGKPASLIQEASQKLGEWDGLDVLYFADSLGNMEPKTIQETIEHLRQGWERTLGFHGHDNKGFALLNSITAIDNGVEWIDGTVTGMGRGAGNTTTEGLLIELQSRGFADYNPAPLLGLVLDGFANMKRKYGWGRNILYHLSAQHDIHPTYVQELMSSPEYGTTDIISAIQSLCELSETSAFNSKSLDLVLQEYSGTSNTGTWSPEGIARGRSVLIVGTGPSVGEHRDAIQAFIREQKPVVLGLNLCKELPSELVDYYVASHKVRFLTHSEQYGQLKKPLICPFFDMPEEVRTHLAQVEVLEYGMELTDRFSTRSGGCTLPKPLTFAYALAISSAAQAENVFLVGFDGYEPVNKKQREMERLLEKYSSWPGAHKLSSLTPTTYGHIQQGSIYSPVI